MFAVWIAEVADAKTGTLSWRVKKAVPSPVPDLSVVRQEVAKAVPPKGKGTCKVLLYQASQDWTQNVFENIDPAIATASQKKKMAALEAGVGSLQM